MEFGPTHCVLVLRGSVILWTGKGRAHGNWGQDDLGGPRNRRGNRTEHRCLGIQTSRRGLGQVRHIEVHQLWLQDKIAKGEMGIEKIDGKTNPADALTKPCDKEMLDLHLECTSTARRQDRHELAPKLSREDPLEEFDMDGGDDE